MGIRSRIKSCVAKAMGKELHTGAQLRCVSRKQRSEARNIIGARWVLTRTCAGRWKTKT